jgi:WD40 repeat protein
MPESTGLGLLLCGLIWPFVVTPTVAGDPPQGVHVLRGPVTLAWEARYDGPGHGVDTARAMTITSDGSIVFVTGWSEGSATGPDYATTAYDAITGALLWAVRYDGLASAEDRAFAIAASPDGTAVFVTGRSAGVGTDLDYTTVAYDSGTGAELWVARYDGPASATDDARAVAVSPDGGTVFVTGGSEGIDTLSDVATIAYDATTGEQVWIDRYDGPGASYDSGTKITVTIDGTTIFVGGGEGGFGHDRDYLTLAYRTATGERVWQATHDGLGSAFDLDNLFAMAVSPDGSRVFVTGSTEGPETTHQDSTTVAYDAATGDELWIASYDGPASLNDESLAIAVSPDGTRVFATGYTVADTGQDYATWAYEATTGQQIWLAIYEGAVPVGDFDNARAIAVSHDGAAVLVTGRAGPFGSQDYATLAYDAATGAAIWIARYDGPASDNDITWGIELTPTTSTVFVTGFSTAVGTGTDYTTIAYSPTLSAGPVHERATVRTPPATESDIFGKEE